MNKIDAKLDFIHYLRKLLPQILRRAGSGPRNERHLMVIERVALTQRQFLVLVEADGRRLLVATSPDGVPAVFPLDQRSAVDEHNAGLNLMKFGRRVL